jgi:RNA polymerase subunit RPABC4/transcription elongation factor Spt4
MEVGAGERLSEILGGIVLTLLSIPAVAAGVAFVGAYVIVLWFASAWWVFQDMRRRHPEPAVPYLAAGFVMLASPLLFPLALLVYAVLRPALTLPESRIRRLEERLEELDEGPMTCPGCRRLVGDDWLACPSCRTRLGYSCRDCGRLVGLDWHVCGWCEGEFGEQSRTPVPADAVVGASVAIAPIGAGRRAAAGTDGGRVRRTLHTRRRRGEEVQSRVR